MSAGRVEAPLLSSRAGFTRGGRRSTFLAGLTLRPPPKGQAKDFTARQAALYARLRADAEASIDALQKSPSRSASLPPEARGSGNNQLRQTIDSAANIGPKRPRAGRRLRKISGADGSTATETTSAGTREGLARSQCRSPRSNGQHRQPTRTKLHSRGRARFNAAAAAQAKDNIPDVSDRVTTPRDLWGRLAGGVASDGSTSARRGRGLSGVSGRTEMHSTRVAHSAVQMRRALESMASEMRKSHQKANNQQRIWEERRAGKQQRIEQLMHEARRQIGSDIHREMVEQERAKLKLKRAMPRKLRKHEKGWAGFESDVESGQLNEIRLADIPFPPRENPLCMPAGGTTTSKDTKQLFRQASLRWHPDKFMQRYGALLHPAEYKDILERVTETFQAVNEKWQMER